MTALILHIVTVLLWVAFDMYIGTGIECCEILVYMAGAYNEVVLCQ
jgi:hypothetical protein